MTVLVTPDIERKMARFAFLETVHSLCPKVLADLEAAAGGRKVHLKGLPDEQEVEHQLGADQLKTLREWAKGYRLNAPWVILYAAFTLDMWGSVPGAAGRYWFAPPDGLSVPSPPPFNFQMPAPDLTWVPRSQAEKSIRESFDSALAEYLESCERLCEEQGWARLKNRRVAEEHLTWLVRYQVLGESFSKIARTLTARTPRQTIAQPVHEMAELIELPLRKSTGGRPRKPAT